LVRRGLENLDNLDEITSAILYQDTDNQFMSNNIIGFYLLDDSMSNILSFNLYG